MAVIIMRYHGPASPRRRSSSVHGNDPCPYHVPATDNRADILEDLADAGVAVMVVHGDEDEVCPGRDVATWVATREEIGLEHEYVEMRGVTHGPIITASQERIYEFFDSHSK